MIYENLLCKQYCVMICELVSEDKESCNSLIFRFSFSFKFVKDMYNLQLELE